MSNGQFTYKSSVDLLRTFLNSNPKFKEGVDSAKPLYKALMEGDGDFGRANFTCADSPITESSWHMNADTPDPISPPKLWTLDDSLSTASMLAFAMPAGGAVTSAGFSAAQKLADNLGRRAEYFQKLGEGANTPVDPLVELGSDLKRFITQTEGWSSQE